MRYHFVLLPCEATDKHFWNRVRFEANKLIDLETVADYDQLWHVLDTKSGKVLQPEEVFSIRGKLWDAGFKSTDEPAGCIRHF